MGYMWNARTSSPLNGKHILMFSPQGLAAKGYQNRNLFQSGYLLGEWRPGRRLCVRASLWKWITATTLCPAKLPHPDGRRIVIGWLDMWESPLPEQQDGWAACCRCRELSLSADNRP